MSHGRIMPVNFHMYLLDACEYLTDGHKVSVSATSMQLMRVHPCRRQYQLSFSHCPDECSVLYKATGIRPVHLNRAWYSLRLTNARRYRGGSAESQLKCQRVMWLDKRGIKMHKDTSNMNNHKIMLHLFIVYIIRSVKGSNDIAHQVIQLDPCIISDHSVNMWTGYMSQAVQCSAVFMRIKPHKQPRNILFIFLDWIETKSTFKFFIVIFFFDIQYIYIQQRNIQGLFATGLFIARHILVSSRVLSGFL